MKIAVISDTHGNYPGAVQALSRYSDLSALIHLGDNHDDAFCIGIALGLPVIGVSGNCDPRGAAPRELTRTIGDVRFLMTHGDLFQVKSGLDRLIRRAEHADVHAVLFGHTHVPSITKLNGIILINPGCMKTGEGPGTHAILSVTNGTVAAEIIE
jgi:putative phosphoesterase